MFQEEAADYGIDWSGPVPDCVVGERVVVPDTPKPLSTSQLSILETLVDPLDHCDDFGKKLYVATRTTCERNGCVVCGIAFISDTCYVILDFVCLFVVFVCLFWGGCGGGKFSQRNFVFGG